MGFAEALLVLFIGLKLGGLIDWSWWWVMSPLWGTIVLALVAGSIWGYKTVRPRL